MRGFLFFVVTDCKNFPKHCEMHELSIVHLWKRVDREQTWKEAGSSSCWVLKRMALRQDGRQSRGGWRRPVSRKVQGLSQHLYDLSMAGQGQDRVTLLSDLDTWDIY